MAAIPLIQPSSSASRFSASDIRRSIFSTPTVDINDASTEQDLNDEYAGQDEVPTLYLDPSPIGKGTAAESWTRQNRTIGATFRPSTNELAVFVAGKKAAEEVGGSSVFNPSRDMLHDLDTTTEITFPVKQHSSAKDNTVFLCQASIPESRIPFITQMFGIFLNTTAKDPYAEPEVYKRHFDQYYEGIQRNLLQLYESKSDMETAMAAEHTQELDLMEKLGAIWQLAEFVFFTGDDKKPIAFLFCEWLSAHDTSFDVDIGKTLLRLKGRLSHPDFWPYIYQCLLRGMRKSVIFMVEQTLNDETDEDAADALEVFLKALQGIPSSETTIPDGKTHQRHRKWQEECLKIADSKLLKHLGEAAQTAMSILIGDVETILSVTDVWEEAFSGILLYTNPSCPRYELSPILKICSSRYLEDTDVSLIDRIKIAILEMDAIKTIRHCGNFHPWLVAHLADVLQQYDYLNMSQLQLQDIPSMGWDMSIRDFFLTSYAQSLMSNTNLWEATAGYLLNCGHTGKAMLGEWICHVPLESSRKAHKVMRFCKDNDLADSLRSINRVMAVEEEKRGQYALAIQHFIASKDNDRVAKVADDLMLDFLQNGNLDLQDTLASIPNSTLNYHVEFLRSYARFHQDYKNGSLTKAGRTLIQLMSSGKAPTKYWAVMLFDALPLLENKRDLVFDSSDTYEMMRCLEEVVGSQHKVEYLQLLSTRVPSAAPTAEDKEELLSLVRLSLVRNLARSFVHQPRDMDLDVAMAE
ncbi:Nucleoporin nup85 [Dissophora globulifera]|uniref:Nuclear pore complex protein Nup85 n=1 Tax=Dissophora globulifera TaxID=979702 RepID=A0A9P6UU68_9FUNG|nr:Nucleoporin nup85 [Dissophora globulifera]